MTSESNQGTTLPPASIAARSTSPSSQTFLDGFLALEGGEWFEFCDACEDSGWECYGIGHNDPHFRECPVCHNPRGIPSP